VFIDKSHQKLTPLYNYLKPAALATLDAFFDLFGNADAFAYETSSPALGMLNTGFQIFRLKKELPDIFSRVKYAVHLPQYLSSFVSKNVFSDMTSIGCHTGMWDFRKKSYHPWLSKEGILELLPHIAASATGGYLGGIEIGVGLHDSSSALLPFLHMSKEPFIFLSTGTWAITFNAFEHSPLTRDDLANDVLVYMLPNGQPVKASRCLLGKVHDERSDKIISYFGMKTGFYNSAGWDETIYQRIVTDNAVSGWEHCDNGFEAYYVMMDELIRQYMIAFERVNSKKINTVYVDGGFARNPVFMTMLRRRLVDKNLVNFSIPESTAIGALIQLKGPRKLMDSAAVIPSGPE
jgi:sugar (pentulose or hexulose) kinase